MGEDQGKNCEDPCILRMIRGEKSQKSNTQAEISSPREVLGKLFLSTECKKPNIDRRGLSDLSSEKSMGRRGDRLKGMKREVTENRESRLRPQTHVVKKETHGSTFSKYTIFKQEIRTTQN